MAWSGILLAGRCRLPDACLRWLGGDQGLRDRDPPVAIVLMAGFGPAPLREEAAQIGVAHCFEKPFNRHDMFLVVRQLLAARGDARP